MRPLPPPARLPTRPAAPTPRVPDLADLATTLLAATALLAAAAPAASQALTPGPGDVVVTGGQLWDGTADEARPNPGILIRNGTILRVGSIAAPGAGAEVVALEDRDFIMPGLFDLHAHYAVDLFGEGRVDEYTVNPVLFLANGVTSTFPAGEVDTAEAARGRERIAAGEIPGPRIYRSGPYWGTARPGWRHEAMTPDSLRTEAAWWALRGVHGFKAKGIRPEQLEALIDVAHEHGLTVTGHLDSGFRSTVNPRDAILMGIDRIEHFLGGAAVPDTRSAYASLEALDLDDPATAAAIRDQARLFVEHGVFFDATLTAYGYYADREPAVFERWVDEMGFLTPYAREVVEAQLPRRRFDQFERIYYVKRRTLGAFHAAGATSQLTLGTDHPTWGEYLNGFSAHRELHAMVLAGIPNADALRAGTIHGARALGVSERLGTIEPGKYADLVVVRGDPLTDIRATRNVRLVIRAGDVYNPAALLESVRGGLGPAGTDEAEWWKGDVRLGR